MGGARGEAELQGGVATGAWLRVTSRHLAGCGVPPCHAWRGAAGGGGDAGLLRSGTRGSCCKWGSQGWHSTAWVSRW